MFFLRYSEKEFKKVVKDLFALFRQKKIKIPVAIDEVIDLFKSASSQNLGNSVDIKIEFEDMAIRSVKGRLFPCGKYSWIIKLDPSQGFFHQRFTTCHEAVHILVDFFQKKPLHKKFLELNNSIGPAQKQLIEGNSFQIDYLENKIEEIICDEITMLLLCPPSEVEKFLKENVRNKEYSYLFIVKEMANTFEVPSVNLLLYLKKFYNREKLKDIFNQFS